MANEITTLPSIQQELDKYTLDEMDGKIRQALLEWVDSDEKLDPVVKEAIVQRADQLRLKFQTIFVEYQKHVMKELLFDVEAESELRREMRLEIPYMTATEKANALKAMTSTQEDKLERLERQMAGWDLFSNTQFSLQSSSESRVPLAYVEKVKDLTPAKRRQLLNIIEDIKEEVVRIEKAKDEQPSST